MTNEEAAAMLESMKNYFLPTSPMLEERREITAIDLAISALSKQSASSEQVDKSVIVDFVAFQREWLNSHKTLELDAVNNALVNIFLETTGKAFIDSLGQSAENDEDRATDDQCGDDTEMVDQFREDTKKTDFKPGDKFILELGQERRMFGDFEIKGTDLYVKTDLLDKLKRYEPEENATADKILIDLAEAIETVKFECGEWQGLAQTIVNGLKKLSPAQPEIIRCEDCKHRGEKPIADGRYWCDLHGTFMYYCSDAKRRTDEGFN